MTKSADAIPSSPDRGQRTATNKRRASLTVRIILGALAVLFLLIAILAAINLYAVNTYNQATASLESNLKARKSNQADLTELRAQEEQIQAQLQDAGTLGFLLLPQVKTPIANNAQVSQRLSQLTRAQINRQEGSSTGQKKDVGQSSDNKGHGGKPGSGLSENQRKDVDRLLQSNGPVSQPRSSDGSSGRATTNNTEENKQAKPW